MKRRQFLTRVSAAVVALAAGIPVVGVRAIMLLGPGRYPVERINRIIAANPRGGLRIEGLYTDARTGAAWVRGGIWRGG